LFGGFHFDGVAVVNLQERLAGLDLFVAVGLDDNADGVIDTFIGTMPASSENHRRSSNQLRVNIVNEASAFSPKQLLMRRFRQPRFIITHSRIAALLFDNLGELSQTAS
jgi:hypothetical protein